MWLEEDEMPWQSASARDTRWWLRFALANALIVGAEVWGFLYFSRYGTIARITENAVLGIVGSLFATYICYVMGVVYEWF